MQNIKGENRFRNRPVGMHPDNVSAHKFLTPFNCTLQLCKVTSISRVTIFVRVAITYKDIQ